MTVFKNLSSPQLWEESIRRHEARLTEHGALVSYTGRFTGRAAKDKYIVCDATTQDTVDWSPINQKISIEQFSNLKNRVLEVLSREVSFEMDLSAGADPLYALPIKICTTHAYHAQFAKTLFRGPLESYSSGFTPFTIYHAPAALAVPAKDGTNSPTFVAINFTSQEILIGGTYYAGEIKKSIFTVMNYLLPQKGIMTMHAAANVDNRNQTTIFFGLSGTGKTTLSADSYRRLIGDDEHGWSATGIFNFEGGCYAKAIRLSRKSEPEIWDAAHSYGSLLENVEMDPNTRTLNFDSPRFTENTRCAYPIEKIPNHEPSGCGGHPTAIIMLACDAFGVLPPIAELTPEQASYYFLSGYTAKVAGTEAGITEPTSTFSACFGEPFMSLNPVVYANLLSEKLKSSKAQCFLVNTGWWKGPAGGPKAGERMPISMSRSLVHAATSGELGKTPHHTDPIFGFSIPKCVPGVESEHLVMENTWTDKEAYRKQARHVARLFIQNFKRYEGKGVPDAILKAGPVMGD